MSKRNSFSYCYRCKRWLPVNVFRIVNSKSLKKKYHPFGNTCLDCCKEIVQHLVDKHGREEGRKLAKKLIRKPPRR